jgi:cytochrome b subunit of formate dehydrogenase
MQKANLRPRSDAMTAFLHWSLFASVMVSLLSGLAISAETKTATWSAAIRGLLLQGAVLQWHIWSSVAITLISVAYAIYLVRSRMTGRIALDASRLRALSAADRRMRWHVANVLVYWLAFGLIATMAVTGLILYSAAGLLPHETVATVHRAAAWGFVAYVILHVLMQLVYGGMRQITKLLLPRLAYGAAAGIAVAAGGGAVAAVYALDQATIRPLRLQHIGPDEAPKLDGRADEPVWQRAQATVVHTNRSSNAPGGEVPITIRALHDGQNAYFDFEWPDATRSQKHLPLLKTALGWKVVEQDYGRQDEEQYYEDKFGVMLSRSAQLGGGGAVHLGPKPIAVVPGSPNQRGLHYTTDGSIVDVWHWKSVRTGAMNMIDDNYFGPPMEPTKAQFQGEARYTGGYTQDPKSGGDFIQNWKKLDAGIVQPLYLPSDPKFLNAMGLIDLNPEASDDGQWWLPASEVTTYSAELDAQYPQGTVIPSVIIEKPFEGDRGDVHAVGNWENGKWRLEVSRKLDTGSQYDQQIETGMYLWMVAFDHSQTRHSRHLHPLRLELEP